MKVKTVILKEGESYIDSLSLYVNGKESILQNGDALKSCFDFIIFFNK